MQQAHKVMHKYLLKRAANACCHDRKSFWTDGDKQVMFLLFSAYGKSLGMNI